ncbi:tripartite tricarboxylate transporter TctB family protein [Corynebacterium glutamicum]|uniref:tripartite tricarboxylate transporter TctB family protein n=1 Tax=Corynebacterium glutamicum TaxID=1718 RepID=UPI0009D68507|nr:tripartite tricarboxylate transporter TctB family protein [Corynebacterium glutamicum]
MTSHHSPPDISQTPDVNQEPGQNPEGAPQSRHFLGGRGSLFVAAALGIFTIYIVYGIFTMEVPESAQAPGPKLYPTLLAIVSGVLTIALIIDTFRHPDEEPPHRYTAPVGETVGDALIPVKETDKRNLALAIIAFLVFAFILEPLGWIISAALLFWAIALCLGSGRPVFNLAVGLVVSSAIQVAFSMGLGLSLPAGILGGIF